MENAGLQLGESWPVSGVWAEKPAKKQVPTAFCNPSRRNFVDKTLVTTSSLKLEGSLGLKVVGVGEWVGEAPPGRGDGLPADATAWRQPRRGAAAAIDPLMLHGQCLVTTTGSVLIPSDGWPEPVGRNACARRRRVWRCRKEVVAGLWGGGALMVLPVREAACPHRRHARFSWKAVRGAFEIGVDLLSSCTFSEECLQPLSDIYLIKHFRIVGEVNTSVSERSPILLALRGKFSNGVIWIDLMIGFPFSSVDRRAAFRERTCLMNQL